MATLDLIIQSTGEQFTLVDVDFSVVTPRDILMEFENSEFFPERGSEWCLLKGSIVVDTNTSLESLGFKDGDKAKLIIRTHEG
jgi:hypothetical protein